MIELNIFYNDNTLYVNLDEYLDDYVLNKLKKRVFNILEDYDIENIVLNIVTIINEDKIIIIANL